MTELAERAIACRHWRWMPGMLGLLKADPTSGTVAARLTRGWRVEQADLTASFGAGAGPASIHEVGVWLPDLNDPATLGCLVALVREACGDVVAYRCRRVRIDLEAEALIAALEAAP